MKKLIRTLNLILMICSFCFIASNVNAQSSDFKLQITTDLSAQSEPDISGNLIVWMDGIVFKVREGSKVINKTVYIAVGLRRDGKKEVLGLWLGK